MSKKVVLITGASSGIGKSTAELMHSQGYVVYGTSRKEQALAMPFVVLRMDVTDISSVQKGIDAIVKKEGRIDIVINNAGYSLLGPFEETSVAEGKAQMETNFFGFVNVSQCVLPHMRKARQGLIINVGSIGGRMGLPYQSFYSATKFAMKGITEALRIELKPYNIKVAVVEPGDTATGITDSRSTVSKTKEGSPYYDQLRRTLAVVQKDERNGSRAESIARRILHVAKQKSPTSAYPVGQFIQVLSIPVKAILPAVVFDKIMALYYDIK